jgi:hypothetical protein
VNTISTLRRCVNLILPHMLIRLCRRWWRTSHKIQHQHIIQCGMRDTEGINTFTLLALPDKEVSYVESNLQRSKEEIPTRSWSVKQAPRTRPRRTILRERILRPARLAPSSLRDDTMSSAGQGQCQRGHTQVRFQPPGLLRSRSKTRKEGARWSDTRKARAKRSVQVYERDRRLYSNETFKGTQSKPGRSHYRNRQRVRGQTTSEDYREGDCTIEKKRAQTEAPIIILDQEDGGILVKHYEGLRASVVHTDQTEIHASGLGVFMLRGMIGWIKTIPALEPISVGKTKHVRSQLAVISSENHTDLVNILANMVISCVEGYT